MTHELPENSASERMISVDALRGFNMLWIIGVADITYKLHELYDHPVTAFLDKQLRHPAWDEGFTFYDLIWPLFFFLIGVVIPVSLRRHRARGRTTAGLYLYIVKRALIIYLIGMLRSGPLSYDFLQIYWGNVLQRIAVCYLVTTILFLHTGWRLQVVINAAILLLYWAALMLLEIDGYGPGVSSQAECWVYAFGLSDNAVTTPLSVPSVFFGVWAGQYLHSDTSGARKAAMLAIAGGALIVAASVWGIWFPMIKRIWSSTYVLYAGGWSCLLLALFYWVIDVKGYRNWAFFFVVIGTNALLIYFLIGGHTIVDFEWIAKLFLQGLLDRAGVEKARPLFLMGGALIVKWLLLWYFYRRRIFLRA